MKRIYKDGASEKEMIEAAIEHFKSAGYLEASNFYFFIDGNSIVMSCDNGCCREVYENIEEALGACVCFPDQKQGSLK